MLFKKTFIAASLATIFTTASALAETLTLTTINNTDEDSSVFIESTGFCAPKYTKKHEQLVTSLGNAKIICAKLKGYCEATMYASNNCTGTPVAKLELDLSNAHAALTSLIDARYLIDIANVDSGSIVTIRYVSNPI